MGVPNFPPDILELERLLAERMDEVLQSQLLNALSGEAQEMASSLPAGSYDKVMEPLTAKFGDSFRLAASYIPAKWGRRRLEPQRSNGRQPGVGAVGTRST